MFDELRLIMSNHKKASHCEWLDWPYAPKELVPRFFGRLGLKLLYDTQWVLPMAFCLIETVWDSIIEHRMTPGSAKKTFLWITGLTMFMISSGCVLMKTICWNKRAGPLMNLGAFLQADIVFFGLRPWLFWKFWLQYAYFYFSPLNMP